MENPLCKPLKVFGEMVYRKSSARYYNLYENDDCYIVEVFGEPKRWRKFPRSIFGLGAVVDFTLTLSPGL